MLVHRPGEPAVLLDFFVAAPGLEQVGRRSELVPVEIDFGDATQVFNVGGASCGVPGVPSGLAEATRRFGSMSLAELARPRPSHPFHAHTVLATIQPLSERDTREPITRS